ncbi:hypothetical protein HDV01_004600 [Terramyces sp. JEL0728]|nr:hypothetical protein HDV01_004600 [Terramyces sp. JEL0728]
MSLSPPKITSSTSRSVSFLKTATVSIPLTTENLIPTATPPSPTPSSDNTSSSDILGLISELWGRPAVKITVIVIASLILLSILLCIIPLTRQPSTSKIKVIGGPEQFEYANHLARYDMQSRRMKYEDTIVDPDISYSESVYPENDRESEIFEIEKNFSKEIPDNDILDLRSVSTSESISDDLSVHLPDHRDSMYSEISTSWQSPRYSQFQESTRLKAANRKTLSISSNKDLYLLRESRKGLSEF